MSNEEPTPNSSQISNEFITTKPIKSRAKEILKEIASESLSQSLPTTMTEPTRKHPINNTNIEEITSPFSTEIPHTAPNDPFHCHNEESSTVQASSTTRRAIRVLWLTVFVCLGFMICEVVGGWWAQSLAIITDAAHLLTDLASMLISLFSLYLASRPASQRMSFGWHRADYDINAPIMAITAGIGVLVNLLMGFLLYFGGHSHSHGGLSHGSKTSHHGHSHNVPASTLRNLRSVSEPNDATPLLSSITPTLEQGNTSAHTHSDENINVRAAFVHVLGDLVQSVGVLIAALLILWNNDWGIVDPICTLLFSVIVISTTIYIIRDALVVHDLRIWALTMNKVAISVHLEIDTDAQAQTVLKKTTLMLRKDFNVHESTVQIEGWQEESENCFQCIVPTR